MSASGKESVSTRGYQASLVRPDDCEQSQYRRAIGTILAPRDGRQDLRLPRLYGAGASAPPLTPCAGRWFCNGRRTVRGTRFGQFENEFLICVKIPPPAGPTVMIIGWIPTGKAHAHLDAVRVADHSRPEDPQDALATLQREPVDSEAESPAYRTLQAAPGRQPEPPGRPTLTPPRRFEQRAPKPGHGTSK